jgi:hypothetical protein
MKYCYENNIILCRLPSHTSHKLQPCNVGIFGPLKTAYREEVERLYRGGSNMIGKQHFTLLYDRARRKALNPRNIVSGWSKTGLRPFNPERVLRDIQKPEPDIDPVPARIEKLCDSIHPLVETPETPKTAEKLMSLRMRIEKSIAQSGEIDAPCKSYIQKLANAAENAFADRAILLDENLLLFEQNNEKTTRKSMRATVVGSARVMSYEDICEAQKQRDIKDATAEAGRGRRSKRNTSTQVLGKRSRGQELEEAEHEIKALRMEEYCSVLDF